MRWISSREFIWMLVVLAIVIAAFFAYSFFANAQSGNAPDFPRASMVIQRADGKTFPFTIEIATTREQDMYGLMFRRSLPADAGMLFIYGPDQPVSMWMKNTYIPLDMLFVAHDGAIVKIITHAVPFDLTPLSSGEPVRGVIEINAGEVEHLGLKTGDKVLFSAFSNAP
jgi:uncharacterized membrane protein (UPF0127 family)